MSIRSDLENVLDGGPPGALPWYGDLSYYYFAQQKRGLLAPQHRGRQGEVRFYRDAGVGMYLYAPQVYSVRYAPGYGVSESADGAGIRTEYTTPRGALSSYQKYLPGTFSYAYTKHCVETVEDLLLMADIFEHMSYCESFGEFAAFDALVGEGGLPFALAPISVAPLQKLLARWAGVENTVSLYFDYPDEFAGCVARIERAQMPVFDILARSPARVIAFPENLSSEITGGFWEEFSLPYYQTVNDILHKAGKLTSIHIDGTLMPCLSKLSDAGFDIAEAVTPMPVGDVPLELLREKAGGDIIIWGGLPGALFTPQFTDAQFEAHIREIMRVRDSRFVLGVADQVPPDGLWERVLAVGEIVKRLQK